MTLATRTDNRLFGVGTNAFSEEFPPVDTALRDPDGLLAIGGDLSSGRLLEAYRRGIFPWFNRGQPILWWSPDPRCVLHPAEVHISRSLAKTLRQGRYRVTCNQAFESVIHSCAAPRAGSTETWITDEMMDAYLILHRLGHALSIESWRGNELCGGLYGVVIDRVYFGESMFSRASDASKVAFVALARLLAERQFRLIDCQIYSRHLHSLGARPMARPLFTRLLDEYARPGVSHTWPQVLCP